jgi:DNA-3-methyladenine glycosylase II
VKRPSRRVAQADGAGESRRTVLKVAGPFDLPLSLEAAAIFYPRAGPHPRTLKVALRAGPGVAVMELTQLSREPARIGVSLADAESEPRVRGLAGRLICANLDLRPFYRLARHDPVMNSVTAELVGLKPLQPATIFEAAVIAVTEQQLSMTAAYRIRSRLVHRFGERADDLWLFPGPEQLADAPAAELGACGLSRQKIGYLKRLAAGIVSGELDLESMRADPDAEVRARLMDITGFGRWSVEHVLLHGFGRPGALPSTDVSLRKVVGHYLAHGQSLTSNELERALSSFRPWDGLAAFYLSVAYRRQSRDRSHSSTAPFS